VAKRDGLFTGIGNVHHCRGPCGCRCGSRGNPSSDAATGRRGLSPRLAIRMRCLTGTPDRNLPNSRHIRKRQRVRRVGGVGF
jgi:hypothetical protein